MERRRDRVLVLPALLAPPAKRLRQPVRRTDKGRLGVCVEEPLLLAGAEDGLADCCWARVAERVEEWVVRVDGLVVLWVGVQLEKVGDVGICEAGEGGAEVFDESFLGCDGGWA